MSVEPILNWLGSAAAPGWIAALIMAIGLIIQWLRGRERPSRVIVEQILETTLLSPPKELRDAERVRILYAEEPIDMLWMTELRLRNVGKIVISEPNIYVRVDDETKVLDVQLQQASPGSEADRVSLFVKDNTFMVAYPYLNPFREHKQEMTIKVLCDRKPESLIVEGGGKGWSTAFLSSGFKEQIDKSARQVQHRGNATAMSLVLAILAARLLGYLDFPTYTYMLFPIILFWPILLFGEGILKWWLLRSFR